MRLPNLPVGDIRQRREMVSARGLNYSDNFQDGDLANCRNLSARRWPYLATRHKRVQMTEYEAVTSLTAWNGLIAVSGTDLLYKGRVVGTVTEGEKQFATVNTKVVIWPDQVYLDMNELTEEALDGDAPINAVHNLGAKATATAARFPAAAEGETVTNTVVFTGAPDLTRLFLVGDGVEISGLETLTGNNRSLVIKTVTADTITIEAKRFTVGEETASIAVERKVPPLDFICESGNRLWGVSNEQKTIFSSALGDPTNFYTSGSGALDSWAVACGTVGDFTGCCKLSSAVLFWKENVLHKVLGSYPAEYYMYSYDMEGLRKGCEKSMVIINDVLHYVGPHGVFTYAGGSPSDISQVFGTHEITEAVGGTDGENYYLSCKDDGQAALFTFHPNEGCWLQEDGFRVTDMARDGKDVYLLREDGTVWLADGGEDDPDVDWELEYTPFYETIEGRKRVSRLMIRAELPSGAWMRAETVTDTGRWQEAGKIIGDTADAVSMVVQPNRGDVYRVRLSGHGPCVIKSVLREFLSGGYR